MILLCISKCGHAFIHVCMCVYRKNFKAKIAKFKQWISLPVRILSDFELFFSSGAFLFLIFLLLDDHVSPTWQILWRKQLTDLKGRNDDIVNLKFDFWCSWRIFPSICFHFSFGYIVCTLVLRVYYFSFSLSCAI